VSIAAPAAADSDNTLYERLWPRVPEGRQLKLSLQITDAMTELGNTIGTHASVLSNEMLVLRFDGRKRRAYIRFGGGDEEYLTFRLASDVHFTEGRARITTRLDLAVAGRALHLELPDVEMAPASYRGERGVEIRLPLFRREF
jgi:hypothetical protein